MTSKWLFWAPRLLAISGILFISIFALDAFEEGMSLGQQLFHFLLHLIPSSVLLVILIFSWKHELAGGIIFLLIGLVFTPIIFFRNYQINDSLVTSFVIILAITFPFIAVGILFIISHYRKKKLQAR